jgi:hypothetical protein
MISNSQRVKRLWTYLTEIFTSELGEESSRVETQPTYIRPKLYIHQQTLLQAALELEKTKFNGLDCGNSSKLFANFGILADRVGSGKSLVALSLLKFPPPERPVRFAPLPKKLVAVMIPVVFTLPVLPIPTPVSPLPLPTKLVAVITPVTLIPEELNVRPVPTLIIFVLPFSVILDDPTVRIPVTRAFPSTNKAVVPIPIVTVPDAFVMVAEAVTATWPATGRLVPPVAVIVTVP